MNVLKKYLAYDSSVRVTVVNVTKMVQDARKVHNLSNVATAALGRTLAMTTIMSSNLKEKDNRLTIQIKGDGPLKSIVTCGNNSLKIKGYVTNGNITLPLNKWKIRCIKSNRKWLFKCYKRYRLKRTVYWA